jgi:hypothetical protein
VTRAYIQKKRLVQKSSSHSDGKPNTGHHLRMAPQTSPPEGAEPKGDAPAEGTRLAKPPPPPPNPPPPAAAPKPPPVPARLPNPPPPPPAAPPNPLPKVRCPAPPAAGAADAEPKLVAPKAGVPKPPPATTALRQYTPLGGLMMRRGACDVPVAPLSGLGAPNAG